MAPLHALRGLVPFAPRTRFEARYGTVRAAPWRKGAMCILFLSIMGYHEHFFFQVIGGSGSGAVGCLDFGYCTSSKRFPVRHGSSTSCWLSEALSATDEAFKPQLARTCSRSVCIFARRYSVEQTWVMAKLTEEHWRPGDAEADTGSDTWRLVSETYPSCWKIDWICSSKHAQVEENQWISMDYPWIDLHWMATEPHCSHHFALGDAWSAMGKTGLRFPDSLG